MSDVPDEVIEYRLQVAAQAAKSMGRTVAVLTTSSDGVRADFVGLGLVDAVLENPKTAMLIALPRRDAELLLKDLHQALYGKIVSLEDAVKAIAEKGPKA